MDAVRFVFDDLADYMLATGDTEPFVAECPQTVGICRAVMTETKKTHLNGEYVVAGDFTFDSVHTRHLPEHGGIYYYGAYVRNAPSVQYTYQGVRTDADAGNSAFLEANLAYTDGRWRLTSAQLSDQKEGDTP